MKQLAFSRHYSSWAHLRAANAKNIIVNDAGIHGLRVTTGIVPSRAPWQFSLVQNVASNLAASGVRNERLENEIFVHIYDTYSESMKGQINT